MMQTKFMSLICLGLILALASVSYGLVIGDFEQGMDGWELGWGDPAPTLAFSPIGATLGANSLSIQPNKTGFQWSIQLRGVLDLDTYERISVDVTWVAEEWGDTPWVNLKDLAINSDGPSGWMQVIPDDPVNPSYPGSWGPGWGDHTRTLTWDLSGYDATGATWMQLVISTNFGGDTPGKYYLDNIQLLAAESGVGAHNPTPADGATAVPVDQLLSWNAGLDPNDPNVPNPAITGHNLWLSIPYDPLNPPAGGPNWQDAGVFQIIQLSADLNPPDGNVDERGSYAPSLQRDALYYWIVDESLGTADPRDWGNIIAGSQWSFETVTSGPEVDAGPSVVTWLENGQTTVDLNGTVIDATGDVILTAWAVLVEPAEEVTNLVAMHLPATTAILNSPGRYVLELYAKDAAQHEDSDRMEIYVYGDACEAARNNPNGYTPPPFDYNGDCVVNFIDFAIFAMAWLDNASLTGPATYDPPVIYLPPVVQFTNPLDGATVSGTLTINAIAYDTAVGTNDGDGMLGAGDVFFEVIDDQGTVLETQRGQQAPFDLSNWNTANTDPAAGPVYPNGYYTIRVTATSDAGYVTVVEINVTIDNP